MASCPGDFVGLVFLFLLKFRQHWWGSEKMGEAILQVDISYTDLHCWEYSIPVEGLHRRSHL